MLNAEPDSAVEVLNAGGQGQVCLLCEHASACIPEVYDALGLDDEQRLSHAVWDPGARDLALRLSAALDAPLVASQISRLVYDCNRPPEAESATSDKSELIEVPGNRDLSDSARQQRVDLAYTPFCNAVDDLLDARLAAGQPTAVVTVHSFSPVYFGKNRQVEIGVLHDTDTRLADGMLAQSDSLPGRIVLRNEPYGPEHGVTHSLQLHAVSRGLPNVMIEVRNDLLSDAIAVQRICDELMLMLHQALLDLNEGSGDA